MSSAIDSVKLASFTSPQQVVEVLKDRIETIELVNKEILDETKWMDFLGREITPERRQKITARINALKSALLALRSQTEFEALQKRCAFLQEQKDRANRIILDLLCQACDYDDTIKIIDNLCISAYEEACDYLNEQGVLKEINSRTYKIRKEFWG